MQTQLSSVARDLELFMVGCLSGTTRDPSPACNDSARCGGEAHRRHPLGSPSPASPTRALPRIPGTSSLTTLQGAVPPPRISRARQAAGFDACGEDHAEEARFNRLALRIFELQHALNRPYRRVCESRGVTLENVTNWREIPAAPTSAFKDFPFSCLEERDRTMYFESSGTTQAARGRSYHSRQSLDLYRASVLPWFQHHLLPETFGTEEAAATVHFISLTPARTQVPHSSLVHMLNAVSEEPWFAQAAFAGDLQADGAWIIDASVFHDAVDRSSSADRPVVLAGTAFNFVHLLEQLGSRTLELPAGSRVMETGGYKGRSREMPMDELHARLSLALGIPGANIVTEYGMTELGSQAYDQVAGQRTAKRTFKFPPWVRASVVSVETGCEAAEGEPGLVRVVDLANAFTVLAVETEDVAVRHPDGIELQGRRPAAEPRGCSLMAV